MTVHHVDAGDADRDPLLHVVLGARAWIASIDALIERYAPAEAAGDEPAGPMSDAVAAVLGVLAVRARIVRELDAIADPVDHAAGADAPRPGWLR